MFPEKALAVSSLAEMRAGNGGQGGVNAAIVVMHLLLNQRSAKTLGTTKIELAALCQLYADAELSMEQFHVLAVVQDLATAVTASLQGRNELAARMADRVRHFILQQKLIGILPINPDQLEYLPRQTDEQRQADFERGRSIIDNALSNLANKRREPLMDLFRYFYREPTEAELAEFAESKETEGETE